MEPGKSTRRREVASRGENPPRAAAHRAAGRVIDILELMAESRDGLVLKELSGRLGAPKSSLLPLLRTLNARGYLEQAPAGEYRLGQKALELATESRAHRELPDVARPSLVELMKRTGETVFLGTLTSDAAAVVYIDKVESHQLLRYSAGLGDRRPLHATAIGKAILAFLPAERREEILRRLRLVRYTERTARTLSALRASLEEIRRTGVSINLEQAVPGASGIAAPIFDRGGRVVAACTIGGPTARIRAGLGRLAADVKAAAETISGRLGYRRPDGAAPDRSRAPLPARRRERVPRRSRR